MDVKKSAFRLAEKAGLLDLLQGVGNGAVPQLSTLVYHRVDEVGHRPWLNPDQISALPGQLEAQFRLIARKYHPVCAEEVLEAIDRQRPLPRGAVWVTVDDGYLDFAEVIFPAAQRFGIRPVLFVATAFVGQGIYWWDKLNAATSQWAGMRLSTSLGDYPLGNPAERKQACQTLASRIKEMPFDAGMQVVDELFDQLPEKERLGQRSTLNWEELRELDRRGVTIAAHTHSHPLLSRISFERACSEIRLSQEHVRREIGHAYPIFAFPDGKPDSFTPELVEFLRGEGFRIAVTTVEGSADLSPKRLLCFPRLAVWPGMDLAAFHYHLTPFYPLSRAWLSPLP